MSSRRPLSQIIPEILADWPDAPVEDLLDDITDWGALAGVRQFLVEADGWTGPVALGIKSELKAQIREVAREQRTSTGE